MDEDILADDVPALKDEICLLKDKVAHLKSQLEQSEGEAFTAAEYGQQLLEEKASLEAIREEERVTYTIKLEELIQENYNLSAKLESKEKLLAVHSQENDESRKKKQELEKEQLVSSYERKINEMKSDLKKEKTTHDEEVSQLNLKIQQNQDIIENLHENIAELRKRSKAAENKLPDAEEIQELKTAFETCYQTKLVVEESLSEMIHDNERKSLEVTNLRERLKEMNDELLEKTRQKDDCYQHLEDAKNTIAELNINVNQLEMELKSRGHSKKGNSLFGELEDKRVASEQRLTIFKAKYESLQKAYAVAKSDNLKMKNQVLCFLQTRGDRADRMRIEHLEQALTSKRTECSVLAAKLKKLEEQELSKANDQVNKIKEDLKSFQGAEITKDYVNLLLANAEEYKQEIEVLRNEIEKVRLALIAKNDKLQDTQRKLYTATNTAEKHRNESLRVKLKYETEKGKKAELESFLEKLGIVDKSSISEKNWREVMREKQVVLPRYMQTASASKEEERKNTKSTELEKESKDLKNKKRNDAEDNMWVDFDRKRPAIDLTDEERRGKCIRLLRKTLPKELAEQYIQKYEDGKKDSKLFEENENGLRKRIKSTANKSKMRKVSFKDEVDEFGDNDIETPKVLANISQTAADSVFESSKENAKVVVAADSKQEEACKVQ